MYPPLRDRAAPRAGALPRGARGALVRVKHSARGVDGSIASRDDAVVIKRARGCNPLKYAALSSPPLRLPRPRVGLQAQLQPGTGSPHAST